MDGKVGMLYYLKRVHLMGTRCVNVRKVSLKGSSRLKMVEQTNSEETYLSSGNAVGIVSARWIT